MRACICPNCGAQLKIIDDDREFMFCEYCGARIDLVDRRTVHTEHIIDDAKIKDAEAKIKSAENASRIINIFAAPVEEKQRQAEFERQRQLEADRREYERELRKEQERRENNEAIEDGCAAAMGGCLVKCVKHPIIACIIIFLLLGSCMGSESSSASSTASSSAETVSSSTIRDVSVVSDSEIPASSESKISESALSVSSEEVSASSVQLLPAASRKLIQSFSYQYAFLHTGDSGSQHYWLLDTTNHIACAINTYTSTAYLFSLSSNDFSGNVTIDLGNTAFILHSNTLSKGLSVKYGDEGSYYFYTSLMDSALSTLASIQTYYDLRSITDLSSIPLSDGIRSNGTVSVSTNSVSSSSSTPSKPSPSLDYTPSHKDTNYDDAYALRNPSYTNYCLISYEDKIVRSFTYGNGSKEAYVGHITGGSKSKGLTVHYNYNGGWDETIRISGSHLILVDTDGAEYTFNLSPLSPVRDIYTNGDYRDISGS